NPAGRAEHSGTAFRRNTLAEAERAAEYLMRRMATASPDDQYRLAQWLEALIPWLSESSAAKVLTSLRGTHGAREVVRLARNLGEIGPRLRAEDAELATARLVSMLGKLRDEGALEAILRGLQAVAPRLAAVGAGEAVERISAELARQQVALAIYPL